MAGSYGWAGKILFVDLSSGEINKVATDAYRPGDFIGGLGLSSRIYWEMGCPGEAAYAAENPLIVSSGPLTGTYGPFGKGLICSVSPQSYPDELFNYSSFGGKFPSELKCAGYDALVITGKSKTPVYISIQDENVAIRSAEDLWGVETFKVQQALMQSEGGASVLVIGRAGENLSRIAVVLSETNSAAGQDGFGAVMGSKNLKAIAVKGSGGIRIARPRDLLKLTKIIAEENTRNAKFMGMVFRTPYGAPQEIQDIFLQKYYIKQHGCYGCPQQCQSLNYIPGIGLSGCKCANWGWSPLFSNEPEDIWQANIQMQKLGINSFEMTNGIPLLLKLACESGIVSGGEIEAEIGLPATPWLGGKAGEAEFMESLFNKIADGEAPYSEGIPRFTDYFRHRLRRGEELAGLGEELFTARGYAYHHVDNLASALHWATDSRDPLGSAHEYKDPPDEVMQHFGLPPYSSYQIIDIDKTVYEGAESVTAWVQENQCLKNSLTVCEFWSHIKSFYAPPDLDLRIMESRLFSAATGMDTDAGELARAGERIWILRRAIMVKRENRTREDDTINSPYFNKPITCYGGSMLGKKNSPIDRAKFELLKDRYYRLRGWDVKTGWPTKEKLAELGLGDVARQMDSLGKLP